MPSKKTRAKFYVDENIPIPTVTHLKSLGFSIVHAFDKELIGERDKVHLEYAKEEKKVLISLDKDFKKFRNESLVDHPGIILITVGNNTPQHIIAVLLKVLKNLTAGSLKEGLIRATIDKLVKEKKGMIEEMNLSIPNAKWEKKYYD